jgi:hypothetical protein|tara:strand:- start:1145 stop:1408 length:264 start_codon:yes stop_codon:yes gene_type:complete
MTKIYIYCLFDGLGNFKGVYSSLKAAHRDALTTCNIGQQPVYLRTSRGLEEPSLQRIKSLLNGRVDVKVVYTSDVEAAQIIKTKLKE